ncbi:AcrR family transcriptional regulator [Bacillus thermophilus]|uniref:AcrR family transcriptional regulator n=1 Tax=Siminovitchia thermophila TaxID=1245522 RepID=A0ABS2R1D5_9BACI|nr:TetR/AcrR family transcriptional regulator [Siminovitchia thermophila]MBM7713384.1 AcrR family transcriptional regulator [Siminovitchia thermophila]
MAPPKKFTRQKIIDTAFEIAKAEGIDAITIRKIAAKLGSSIAPIYVNFTDVEQLIQEVVAKTLEVSRQLLSEQQSGEPFRDIGIASIRFAKEYSVLFRDLVMKNNSHMKHNEDHVNILVQQMKSDPLLKGFSDEELKQILLKMQIFQTGLSVMVANDLLPDDFNEEKMIEMLDRTADDVITAARLRQSNQMSEGENLR